MDMTTVLTDGETEAQVWLGNEIQIQGPDVQL